MAANKSPIRIAVSIKKGSGTILIKRSVAGFKIHRSLSKNIWWKTTKYLEKSVDKIRHKEDMTINVQPNSTQFVAVLQDLQPGMTYSIRAYGTNQKGVGYGAVTSFTTHKKENSEDDEGTSIPDIDDNESPDIEL